MEIRRLLSGIGLACVSALAALGSACGKPAAPPIAVAQESKDHSQSSSEQEGSPTAGTAVVDEAPEEPSSKEDAITLLRNDTRPTHLHQLPHDPKRLRTVLAHRAKGPWLDGPATLATVEPPVPAGATLHFSAGVHEVNWKRLGDGGDAVPRDVTIEGAGINETMIRLANFRTNGVVRNLHLRDCTIDANNLPVFNLKSEPASIQAERVRFVRFDGGYGCYIFNVEDGAIIYCRSCEFVGAYGEHPGCGFLTRCVEVARFEDCLFDRIQYGMINTQHVVFHNCTFRDCAKYEETRKALLRKRPPVSLANCRVEWTLTEEDRTAARALHRDLKDLFPR